MLNKKRFLFDTSAMFRNIFITNSSNADIWDNENNNYNHNYNNNDIVKDGGEKFYPNLFEDFSSINYSYDKSQEGIKQYNRGLLNNTHSNNNISFKSEDKIFLEKKEKTYTKFFIQNIPNENNNKKSKYICNFCFKEYTQVGSRNRHEYKKHSNYKGEICHFCGKSYLNLLQHISRCPKNTKNIVFYLNKKKIISDNIYIYSNLKNKITIFNSYEDHKKNIKNYVSKDIKKYLYYPDLVIGKGSSMSVYFGKFKETEKVIAFKIDNIKNKYALINLKN